MEYVRILSVILRVYYKYVRKNIAHLVGTVLQDLYYFYKMLREMSLMKCFAF